MALNRTSIRHLARLAAVVMALAAPLPARAVDLTDLWWNPNESGWGMNIAHQADTLFMTFFVYRADGQPTWFSGQLLAAGFSPGGAAQYAGEIYVTSGPYYGGVFTPGSVTIRNAGTVSFVSDAPDTGSLTYTVDGVTVVKQVQRQTLAPLSLSGRYAGGVTQTNYSCADPTLDGAFGEPGYLIVEHVGNEVAIFSNTTTGSCEYRAAYRQAGRIAALESGTFTCTAGSSSGTSGTFEALDISVGEKGLTGRFFASLPTIGCQAFGTFGGIR